MIRKIYTLLILGLCLGFAACGDDNDGLDPNAAAPVINCPMEEVNVDLNKVDNLPVVAVIKSQAGLRSVSMKIQTVEGTIDYKTVTDFFNPNSYSLSEKLEYNTNYQSFIIEAIDNLDHVTMKSVTFKITDVMERPVITFDPEEIVYDEMEENPEIPRTTFKVISEAGLKSVGIYLVSANGQESKADLTLNGEQEYSYDELVIYKEGDKGLKVKAEDTYGNITISTLPVIYRAIPGPQLVLPEKPISINTGEIIKLPIKIESVRGVQEIVVYRVENTEETEIMRMPMNGEKTIEDVLEIDDFTNATTQLKVVSSDGRAEKNAVGNVKIYVDMDVVTFDIASQTYANSCNVKYLDTYAIVSLKDLKTYSVDYAIASQANALNVDFRFYCYGSTGEPRLYSMHASGTSNKENEYVGTTGSLMDMPKRNTTGFLKLPSTFDYKNATVSSIAEIAASTVSTGTLKAFEIDDVIAFRTGSTSSAGATRIGIMKIVNMTAPKDLVSNNPTARVMTVEIKFPKKK